LGGGELALRQLGKSGIIKERLGSAKRTMVARRGKSHGGSYDEGLEPLARGMDEAPRQESTKIEASKFGSKRTKESSFSACKEFVSIDKTLRKKQPLIPFRWT